MSTNTVPETDSRPLSARRQDVADTQLDEVVNEIVRLEAKPLSIRDIVVKLASRVLEVDSYDVQRAVRRLHKAGRVMITPQLFVLPSQ